MMTIVKQKFVIEQHLKKKTRSEILKSEPNVQRTLDRYVETKDV